MFSLFKKSQKGDGGDGGLASGKAEDMFASAAANALAAAVHNNSTPSKAPAPLSTGRRLHGTDIAIDLDDLRPNEAVHELKVGGSNNTHTDRRRGPHHQPTNLPLTT